MKTFDEVKQELAALGTKAALDLLQAAECQESTYSQVSKALCGKENATPDELLKAVDQLESRLAQVERERDAAVIAILNAQHYIKDLGAVNYGLQQLEKWDYYIKQIGACEENTKDGNEGKA